MAEKKKPSADAQRILDALERRRERHLRKMRWKGKILPLNGPVMQELIHRFDESRLAHNAAKRASHTEERG